MSAPSSTFDTSLPVGAIVADKYRVERLLGVGGMGSVLEASHLALGHRVALKVLHPAASGVGDAVPRFLREARATAALESDHVVRIFDLGTTEQGLPFLVMERLTGVDLDELLSQLGMLPLGLALECVYQAACGVREAHAAGIIHRDLKPSNLFLVRTADGRPLIKVLDFGISKLQAEPQDVQLTQTRAIVGSPQYMSPEQVRDAREVTVRSDVWALGAILHELLSGKPAFKGDTLPAVSASIVADDPSPIERTDVPLEVHDLRLRCLAKNPEVRVPSADALIGELLSLRQKYPSPPLDSLSVVFPERSLRASGSDSRVMKGPSFPSAAGSLNSMPTIDESTGEASWSDSGAKVPTGPPASPTLTSEPNSGRTSSGSPRDAWIVGAGLLVLGVGALTYFLVFEGPGAAKTDEPRQTETGSAPQTGAPSELASPGQSAPSAPRPEATALSLLDITSEPMGALIVEDGRVLGQTPANLELSFGDRQTREFELRLDGYSSHLLTVSKENLGQPIEVRLVRAPTTSPRLGPKKSPSLSAGPSSPPAPAPSDIRMSR